MLSGPPPVTYSKQLIIYVRPYAPGKEQLTVRNQAVLKTNSGRCH